MFFDNLSKIVENVTHFVTTKLYNITLKGTNMTSRFFFLLAENQIYQKPWQARTERGSNVLHEIMNEIHEKGKPFERRDAKLWGLRY
jgi:hypothetical protein